MKTAYFGYHELSTHPAGDVYTVTPAQLRRSLRALCSALPHRGFRLTFDDAHISHPLLACSVLEEFGLRGHFFVPTARVDQQANTATWEQLRRMQAAGHTLGSHSHTHPLLTSLSLQELDQELQTSRRILEDQLGVAVDSISLPGGRANRQVMEACHRAGYRQIFTSAPCGPSADGKVVHGRLIVLARTSDSLLIDYTRGTPRVIERLQRAYRLRCGVRAILGDHRYQQLWQTMLRKQALPSSIQAER